MHKKHVRIFKSRKLKFLGINISFKLQDGPQKHNKHRNSERVGANQEDMRGHGQVEMKNSETKTDSCLFFYFKASKSK